MLVLTHLEKVTVLVIFRYKYWRSYGYGQKLAVPILRNADCLDLESIVAKLFSMKSISK